MKKKHKIKDVITVWVKYTSKSFKRKGTRFWLQDSSANWYLVLYSDLVSVNGPVVMKAVDSVAGHPDGEVFVWEVQHDTEKPAR